MYGQVVCVCVYDRGGEETRGGQEADGRRTEKQEPHTMISYIFLI